MNNRIPANSRQRGHIKDAANILSSAKYVRFADKTAGGKVERGDADESSDLLTVELSQFGQLSQESRTGMRAYAFGVADNFIFFTEVIGRFRLWLNDLCETGKDVCIDGVGLGEFSEASGEITDLSWGGDNDLEVCLKQFGDNGAFVTASCFEDDQCDFVRLKDFGELTCARGIVGQRCVDEAGTRGDVKRVFGNVDADEDGFIHGFLPILQMRTRPRSCLRQEDTGAVPAAVRVSPTAAASITLCDGLEGLDTLVLSSPASFGSARCARLTERRIYYGTLIHGICQHTRTQKAQGVSIPDLRIG
jgi:hypothetical protein